MGFFDIFKKKKVDTFDDDDEELGAKVGTIGTLGLAKENKDYLDRL